jgi:hypothetical protein
MTAALALDLVLALSVQTFEPVYPYMHPIMISGIKANFALRFNCKCHTRKPGMMAKVKSDMMLKMLYT